eukprot:2109065-Prymnesium_polylepis.1
MRVEGELEVAKVEVDKALVGAAEKAPASRGRVAAVATGMVVYSEGPVGEVWVVVTVPVARASAAEVAMVPVMVVVARAEELTVVVIW